MYLAAAAGTRMLGTIGLGGLAVALATALILGTRHGAKHTFRQGLALTVGLAAGTVWTGAGQIWGMPGDLTFTMLSAIGVGDGHGVLGNVGMGAIAIVCVLIAYLVTLKPRAAGVLGVVMASVFATAGGAWSMLSQSLAHFAMQVAA